MKSQHLQPTPIKSKVILFCLFLISSVSAFLTPLIHFKEACITRDWGLFNSFSLFSHSSWRFYHKIPIHNPYVLGGMDNLANPQTKVFSPLAIFDVFLNAPYANLASLISLGIIGSYGMYHLLKYLNIRNSVAIICAIIFIHGSWFHLHYSEGHIIFGGFMLFGFVILSILRMEENKYKLIFALICAFFFLDGGIYAFVYTVLLFFTMHLFQVNGISFRKLILSIRKNLLFSLLSVFVFIGLASFKLIPFLILHGGRIPVLENNTLNVYSVFNAFFNPNAHVSLVVPGANFRDFVNFHEIGAYIGFIAFAIILYYLLKFRSKKNRAFVLLMLLFFWIGSGWLDPVNPWRLFQQLPVINNAHVQSRAFIIVYCVLIIFLAFGLEKLAEQRKTLFKIATGFLILEGLFISNWAYLSVYQYEHNTAKIAEMNQMITYSKIDTTFSFPDGRGWGFDFEHFNRWNACTKAFMDPSTVPITVKAHDEPGYRGEIYLLNGEGKATVDYFIPGELKINYQLQKDSEVQLNTNYILGWKTSNASITTKGTNNLLTLSIPKGNGTVRVYYAPKYWIPCVILSITALVLTCLMFWNLKRNTQSE